MDPRVLRARSALSENPAFWASLERRVNWEFQGCLVTQGDRDLRDPTVSQARSVLKEKKGRRGHGAAEDLEDQQGNQEQRGLLAMMAPQGQLEREDLKGPWEGMESQAPRDQWVQAEKMDFQVTQVREESRDSKGRPGLQDHQVSWVL
ncbi:hypothetical protein CRUP_034643, partial [Coryphaenoides rupestris]